MAILICHADAGDEIGEGLGQTGLPRSVSCDYLKGPGFVMLFYMCMVAGHC